MSNIKFDARDVGEELVESYQEYSSLHQKKTQELTDKMDFLCKKLLVKNGEFKPKDVFEKLQNYIRENERIVYFSLSSIVFQETSVDENAVGTIISNIESMIEYAEKEKNIYIEGMQEKEIKIYNDTTKALIKMWDHVNLAQRQYQNLKQTDEEYQKKFEESIEPVIKTVSKDLTAQLLTLVSIFTALAFLLFGGISSLQSILQTQVMPLTQVLVTGSVWGLCILNSIFVFLFCIAKMANLDFRSKKEESASVFQKYPIIWWSDFMCISILIISVWLHLLVEKNVRTQFAAFCFQNPELITIVLFFGLFVLGKKLLRETIGKKAE